MVIQLTEFPRKISINSDQKIELYAETELGFGVKYMGLDVYGNKAKTESEYEIHGGTKEVTKIKRRFNIWQLKPLTPTGAFYYATIIISIFLLICIAIFYTSLILIAKDKDKLDSKYILPVVSLVSLIIPLYVITPTLENMYIYILPVLLLIGIYVSSLYSPSDGN